jgi:hypothetical protein
LLQGFAQVAATQDGIRDEHRTHQAIPASAHVRGPNLSSFCCKMETWLRIAGVPYEVFDVTDPRKGPRSKKPFIEDASVRIADSSLSWST